MADAIASAIHAYAVDTGKSGSDEETQWLAQKLEEAAEKISTRGKSVEVGKELHNKVHRIVIQELKVCGYGFMKLPQGYDPLSAKESPPVLIQPRGDWCFPHCVAVYNKRLFDPSEQNVLSLIKRNLDSLCGGKGAYRGVKWAKILVPK